MRTYYDIEETDAYLGANELLVRRFPSFVTVVQQLWDGDPPEVWEAARRLRDAGRSRDWVLDRLARTWDAHGGDDERYVAALKEL